jgi:hypothetical protein
MLEGAAMDMFRSIKTAKGPRYMLDRSETALFGAA